MKGAGFTDQQSEVQARQLEEIIAEVKGELATKKDLELSVEKLRYETLRFVVWTGIGVVAALGGMLAKGFRWF